MKPLKTYQTPATLHRGVSHMPGVLKLSRGRLSFTADGPGKFFGFQLRRLERDACKSGLVKRLTKGQRAKVFDARPKNIAITYNRLGSIKLVVGDLKCRVQFYDLTIADEVDQISGLVSDPITASVSLYRLIKGRKKLSKLGSESSRALAQARAWKKVLQID